ncbi:hypothetical protein [Ornithinibacillus sp. JPR2-1]|uniref:hypothetical protein n=1 Tax=Ornithinibacillus sp. JPR2-1 TaxID=2094019 RepID=UPI0031E160C3
MSTFTNEELKSIIKGNPVGEFHPYNLAEYDHEAVNDYISSVVGSISAIKNLAIEANFDSYGSGYASYVDVFCYKKDGSSSEQKDYELWIDGIRVYINRLAPVAIFGESEIKRVLEKFHFTILDKTYLNEPLPFQAKIPTILADPPYKLFDALFYWED